MCNKQNVVCCSVCKLKSFYFVVVKKNADFKRSCFSKNDRKSGEAQRKIKKSRNKTTNPPNGKRRAPANFQSPIAGSGRQSPPRVFHFPGAARFPVPPPNRDWRAAAAVAGSSGRFRRPFGRCFRRRRERGGAEGSSARTRAGGFAKFQNFGAGCRESSLGEKPRLKRALFDYVIVCGPSW